MVAKRRTRAAKTGADQAVQEDQVQDVQAGARRRQRVAAPPSLPPESEEVGTIILLF